MYWCRILGVCAIATLLSACGVLGGGGAASTPTTAAPPTGVPSTSVPSPAARPAASPTTAAPPAAPRPTATDEPAAAADTVWVGNTDGEGVYVRKTPAMADRIKPYADGTPLTIVGDDVDGEGQQWKHIKTPDGLEGYVPSIYTVSSPP